MKKLIILGLTLLTVHNLQAAPVLGAKSNQSQGLNKTAAGCNATTAVIDLDINNVRAHLMNGGDMWWDIPTGTAFYEVPKGSNKNSLFSGSIWIGGFDRATGVLKVAAQTYRQTGNDFWSGPLDETNGYSITFQTCADWDRFWKINASDVNKFKGFYQGLTDPTQIANALSSKISDIPDIIKQWPAEGNPDIKSSSNGSIAAPKREMAEYVNVDGQPGYNWRGGDYPKILGDQYIWWVFNDRGDAKTETTSESIGLEIHAAAFAFATNDCLNEATFYNYKIYNFSTNPLDSTYMATWCDADLGYAFDDFVGCDTARGLGILYNGDSYDEGAQGYGFEIPMVGVDYFQGPKYFNQATQRDTELKMTVFTYFNNVSGVTGNPDVLDDYYQFITGSWKDGQCFTTACNARDAGPCTKFIFYGDPCKGGWTESTCNNTPNDRRFIHSSGPFPLLPGAEPNNITIGAVWVPNTGGGSSACFSKIQICDDKAQDLFDNAFKLPFGPQAPQVVVQPLDRKLVFDLDNLPSSNNFGEGYGTNLTNPYMREVSKKAVKAGSADSLYKFEGYLVYQLKNENVALSDIRSKDGSVNTDVARIVFQCDKKNGVKDILNFEVDPAISSDYYVPKLMVSGTDAGIRHSFKIDQDAFATGTSKSLVNYKSYYYLVVAYGYNNFKKFDAARTDSTQDKAYIESRTDGLEQPIKVIKAMPHPATDSLYIQTYADYGTGIQLKRIEGKGNGGMALELTEESEEEAVNNGHVFHPIYKPWGGPMTLAVVNPDSIKAGEYEVWFDVKGYHTSTLDTSRGAKKDSARWYIKRIGSNEVVWSDVTLAEYNEKYLRKYDSIASNGTYHRGFDWGLAAAAVQQDRPGDNPTSKENGVIKVETEVLFEDVNDTWLSGIRDQDGKSFNNWIRAGIEFSDNTDASINDCSMKDWDNGIGQDNLPVLNNRDQLGTFEDVIAGTFAPYNLANNQNLDECGHGVQYGLGSDRNFNRLQDVYSVDLVFTPDKSKWTRCAVIEMTDQVSNSQVFSENGAYKYNLRKHAGWNKDVDANGNPVYSSNPSDTGMSWFPGYAINLETGERLNISFGEESFNGADQGRDLLWNPTSRAFDGVNFDLKWGGKHVIYIHRTKYDQGAAFASVIKKNTSSTSDNDLRGAYRSMMWVGVPMLAPGSKLASVKDGIIPTNTRVKLRVTRPYAMYQPDPNQTLRNGGWPLYTFSTKDIAPAKLGDANNNYTNNKDEIFKRIHVVPNPYYAYSQYEANRVENKVRIINLPDRASIKIYTLDGALIKTIEKNDNKTAYVDWDLKNNKAIPIASGMYLVHVSIPGVGETVLKWFGAMRPIDLISF
ncbi:MAG: T9SS type A sorting domain-containing protein [Chitinophagaceae bacterium]|nr:T9SS type A sorting domain-containing protein [Chitinophagaceae bacterium]